jgi:hypothetical protein
MAKKVSAFARETLQDKKKRVRKIVQTLRKLYPKCEDTFKFYKSP